jgi:hypothetical protein
MLSLRDQIIARAIVSHLGYEKTQAMLADEGQPLLYARIRRDTILIWALFHNKDIEVVNDLIKQYKCEPVLSEAEK